MSDFEVFGSGELRIGKHVEVTFGGIYDFVTMKRQHVVVITHCGLRSATLVGGKGFVL